MPADVYALGALLYHLLTGQPPFRGDTVAEVNQQIVSADPLIPSRLRPEIPSSLEAICLRCLRKREAERYASANELADDLARFSEGGKFSDVWRTLTRWFGRN